MPELFRVLSIDGGGIRGIIPAMMLAAIEKETKKPTAELFDLIAGTSTGGILALALSLADDEGKPKLSATELVKFYEEEGSTIFSRSAWRRIRTFGSLSDEKYPAEGVESVLEKVFAEARLKEALTDVIVTSYEIERRIPFFFKSRNARRFPPYDFAMKKAARATSAAPTYFEPLKLETGDDADYYALIDGGVYANNPAMCAYVEACSMAPEADILLVSLGTGELTRRLPYEETKDWGLAQWAQPVLNVAFDGVSDTVNYQLGKLLNENRYYRFQVRLNEGSDDMDDTSRTNLRVLKLLTEEIVRGEKNRIGKLCRMLVPDGQEAPE